jgi:chromosome segregation ATPase
MQFQSNRIVAQIFSLGFALTILPMLAMAQVKTTVERDEAAPSAPVESVEVKSEKTVLQKYRDELLDEIKQLDEKIESLDKLIRSMQRQFAEQITEKNIAKRLESLELGVADTRKELDVQYQPLISMRTELSGVQERIVDLKFSLDELGRITAEKNNETQKRFDDVDLKINAIYENYVKKSELSNELAAISILTQKNEKLIELIRQRIDSLDGFQAQNASEAKRLSTESLEIADRLALLQESSEQMKSQISKLNDLDSKVTDFYVKLDDLDRNKTNVIDWDYDRENIAADLARFNEEISRLESVSRDAGFSATVANEELQRVMERINMLELVQPEVGDLRFMREKLDALEYQLNASDFSQRIAEIEQNLKKLEEKLTSSKVEMPKEKSKVKN